MKTIIFIMLALPLSGFTHPGIGIVEDSKGNIYYTDLTHIWKIDASGKKSIAVRSVHSHELFMDEKDNLYGEHLWYDSDKPQPWFHYVWKLSPDGNISKIIPETKGFLEDYSFVRDHFGRMYWADRSKECQKVARKNSDSSITTLGDQCFHNIRYMTSNDHGEVYVVDFQDLKKVDNSGKVKTIASGIADKKWTKSTTKNQNSVMGVWDDREGNIYTAITNANVVKKFTSVGREEIIFTTSSEWMPTGGLIDSKGNLWVLECTPGNEVRVERQTKAGVKTTF
ncbi:MAG: hypothetical protein HOP08_09000 [Cyclobacteriaceae bacterium]|nr:hypothetical protein [Cyclobacteriaceae bacterium]